MIVFLMKCDTQQRFSITSFSSINLVKKNSPSAGAAINNITKHSPATKQEIISYIIMLLTEIVQSGQQTFASFEIIAKLVANSADK